MEFSCHNTKVGPVLPGRTYCQPFPVEPCPKRPEFFARFDSSCVHGPPGALHGYWYLGTEIQLKFRVNWLVLRHEIMPWGLVQGSRLLAKGCDLEEWARMEAKGSAGVLPLGTMHASLHAFGAMTVQAPGLAFFYMLRITTHYSCSWKLFLATLPSSGVFYRHLLCDALEQRFLRRIFFMAFWNWKKKLPEKTHPSPPVVSRYTIFFPVETDN